MPLLHLISEHLGLPGRKFHIWLRWEGALVGLLEFARKIGKIRKRRISDPGSGPSGGPSYYPLQWGGYR